MSVEFVNNSINVKEAINDNAIAWLYEAGGEVLSQAVRNTKVASGKTKGSWQLAVDEGSLTCHIGSNYDNAIWEEFGTGIYAVEGNGRKTPWVYVDEQGIRHVTKGKRPRRMLFSAFNSKHGTIIDLAKRRFINLK